MAGSEFVLLSRNIQRSDFNFEFDLDSDLPLLEGSMTCPEADVSLSETYCTHCKEITMKFN